jgi:acetyl esterase/lipase
MGLDVVGEPLSTGGTKYHGVEVGVSEGYRPLVVDLYLPEPTDKPAPAIVYIHGGAWRVGTRRRFGRAFVGWSPTPLARLAAAGFAVATVDYRLSSEARFPAQLEDVQAVIRWMRTSAGELGIDGDRIVAWGESAGGHLASLAGVTGDRATGDDVCGVISWYGPADMRNVTDPASAEARLLGGTAAELPDLARSASPAALAHPGAPRFQLHHGTQDTMVPISESEALAAALDDVGVPVEFIRIEGADHFWIGAPSLEAIFDASVGFAQRVTAC